MSDVDQQALVAVLYRFDDVVVVVGVFAMDVLVSSAIAIVNPLATDAVNHHYPVFVDVEQIDQLHISSSSFPSRFSSHTSLSLLIFFSISSSSYFLGEYSLPNLIMRRYLQASTSGGNVFLVFTILFFCLSLTISKVVTSSVASKPMALL